MTCARKVGKSASVSSGLSYHTTFRATRMSSDEKGGVRVISPDLPDQDRVADAVSAARTSRPPAAQIFLHGGRDAAQRSIAVELERPDTRRRVEAPIDSLCRCQTRRHVDSVCRQSMDIHVLLLTASDLNHRIFMPARSTSDATCTRDPFACRGFSTRFRVSSPPKNAAFTKPRVQFRPQPALRFRQNVQPGFERLGHYCTGVARYRRPKFSVLIWLN